MATEDTAGSSARARPAPRHTMWQRYAAFLRMPPELTLAWHDRETGARGWLVINSLRGAACGGGTRMRLGLNPREVVYLSKAMELKFSISGPPIGGAKTGIDFDPTDPRRSRVLERWYRAIAPFLKECYGTGGDLNVDEVVDVIPTFERLGLHHPQEGVVRGHLRPDAARFRKIMEHLEVGVEAPAEEVSDLAPDTLTVADLVTGYGVAVSIRRLYERRGRSLEGVRVLLEGFGNVGAACALYLSREGARIAAIRDARRILIEPAGLDAEGVADLFRQRKDKLLPGDDPRTQEVGDGSAFWTPQADVFVCAAISGSVTREVLDALQASGVEVIAAGANQPFREVKIGSTRVAQLADRRFAVLPDILANCGMARTFSYLMESNALPHARPIFAAVRRTIEGTLDEVVARAGQDRRNLLAATLGLALDRIGAP